MLLRRVAAPPLGARYLAEEKLLDIALLTQGCRERSGRGQGQGTAQEEGLTLELLLELVRGEAGGGLLRSHTDPGGVQGRGQPIVEGGPGKPLEILREPTPCASQS